MRYTCLICGLEFDERPDACPSCRQDDFRDNDPSALESSPDDEDDDDDPDDDEDDGDEETEDEPGQGPAGGRARRPRTPPRPPPSVYPQPSPPAQTSTRTALEIRLCRRAGFSVVSRYPTVTRLTLPTGKALSCISVASQPSGSRIATFQCGSLTTNDAGPKSKPKLYGFILRARDGGRLYRFPPRAVSG